MINNSVRKLEDNEMYAVIDTIPYNDGTYIYFSNIKDEDDLCIRKQLKKDTETLLIGLDNKEEVDFALQLLVQKNLEA
ncbi:MAG: hypothetical protein K2I72_00780 [Bacilli bacterium]|nr:hypothetical protein [Bacilli bacterium]